MPWVVVNFELLILLKMDDVMDHVSLSRVPWSERSHEGPLQMSRISCLLYCFVVPAWTLSLSLIIHVILPDPVWGLWDYNMGELHCPLASCLLLYSRHVLSLILWNKQKCFHIISITPKLMVGINRNVPSSQPLTPTSSSHRTKIISWIDVAVICSLECKPPQFLLQIEY